MIIYPISANTPEAQNLIQRLDKFQEKLYPAESNHLDSVETLMQPNVFFIGVRTGDELAGIGGVKRFETYGEIKRMYVPEKFRGKGIGKKIITALEAHLREHHISKAKLETGIHQTAAIGLYTAMGFTRTGPFGNYSPDPLSVFMEKKLYPAANCLRQETNEANGTHQTRQTDMGLQERRS